MVRMMKRNHKKLMLTLACTCIILTICFTASFNGWKYHKWQGPINVLLLTYSRSGSSLLGELLSTIPNSSYFFEPLFLPCQKIKPCDHVKQYYIEQIFNCDGNTLYDLIQRSSIPIVRIMNSIIDFSDPFYYIPKELSYHCQTDRIHVIKVIRLRVKDLITVIRANTVPNLRVVHLFRDPRARYHSLQSGGNWASEDRSMGGMCDEMETDLKLSQHIPREIYTRLRYEDVVDDPLTTVNRLFKILYDRVIPEETIRYMAEHMTGGNSTKVQNMTDIELYYSTYQKSSLDPNRWQNKLPIQQIRQVEEKCQSVMSHMGYKVFEELNELTP